ncbi:MAG: AAA family ATPase [Proteobacteria bacterium]|nr:AAA family ATPase [Pseudomonadota bacterium]
MADYSTERGTLAWRAEGALVELVRKRRVLVVVGAGGVGKTSVAASLALLAAAHGRRSLVLTIDPARRLASSLGIAALADEPSEVPAAKLAAVGVGGGLLHAAMLEQKRTFDEVVARYATDAATCARVMNNKLYQELSTRLAGGQEYAAMEKLHEVVTGGRYDLVVLDTPPTANAVDFLEAPQKMVALVDGAALQIFLRSYERAGRFSFGLLTRGSAFIFRRLARFVGGAFLDDVAAFFGDMHGLLGGFRQRAATVAELLHQPESGFIIVCTAEPRAALEAVALADRLLESELRASAFVVNRVRTAATTALDEENLREALRAQRIDDATGDEAAPLLARSWAQTQSMAAADAAAIEHLRQRCGAAVPYVQVPLLPGDVHDLEALAALAQQLAAPAP